MLVDKMLVIKYRPIYSYIHKLAEEEARRLNKVLVDLSRADDELIQQILENPSKYYVFARIIPQFTDPYDIPRKVIDVLTSNVDGVLLIDSVDIYESDEFKILIQLFDWTPIFRLVLERELEVGDPFKGRLETVSISSSIKIILAIKYNEINHIPLVVRNRMIIVKSY
jgi:hypothetical protein